MTPGIFTGIAKYNSAKIIYENYASEKGDNSTPEVTASTKYSLFPCPITFSQSLL
jgi:hypothetical protein